MVKPLTIIKIYLTLALIVGVFYLTIFKHGNVHSNREDNKGKHRNTSAKLEN
tara:strand:- start:289 stop:444 length:156 start_codon:yes stop_codon:yes gene_type:complete